MRFRFWLGLLILEIIAVVNAIIIFRVLPRPVAGLVAGSVFTLVGAVAVFVAYRMAFSFRTPTLVVVLFYFLIVTLPMWLARLFTPINQPLGSVFGVPIELFHRISVVIFFLLVGVTVIQLVLVKRGDEI